MNHAWKDSSGRSSDPQVGSQVGVLVARVLLAEAQRLAGVPRMPWVPNNPADIIRRSQVGQSPSEFWVRRWRVEAIETALFDGQQRADWYLLRGWLALEAGRCVEARRHFRIVLDTVAAPERWIPEVNGLNALFDPREMQLLQQLSARQNIAWELSRHYLKWLDASQQ